MSQQEKPQENQPQPQAIVQDEHAVSVEETVPQRGKLEAEFRNSDDTAPKQENPSHTAAPVVQKPSKGLALLALLVALGVGGAGYYFGMQKFAALSAQTEALDTRLTKLSAQTGKVTVPDFAAEKAQLAQLTRDYQQTLERLTALEQTHSGEQTQLNELQAQLQKLGSAPKIESKIWLLSDADFLLNNALRKMVLDNDIDTAKSLLAEADSLLSQVDDPKALAVREAIKADLNQLASVNEVDQNGLMQRLAQLANLVDEMPLVDDDAPSSDPRNDEVSDSVSDWQQNLEKSADSFLNRFIRITDKNTATDKVFIAPNQAIYLRENIRLRLQIAILAVPRQQNELYKQSLEAVSTWVRSYFDVQNDNVKTFLKELDELMEQSIYVDAPNRLQSLTLLDQWLNKPSQQLQKIRLESDNSLNSATEAKPEEAQAAPSSAPSAQ